MSAILGVLFAALMGLILIPTYMHYEKTGIDNTRIATTAQQFKLMSDATKAYVQANYVAIEGIATTSSPATITVAALKSTGFLSQSVGAVNPYNQTWFAQILQPTPGNLQALVLSTGGEPIEEVRAPLIAAQAGAQGGFIPYNGQYGTLNSTVAQGSYGGWQLSMAGYSNPGPGHLAGLLFFNNGNLANNYLYRVAVPGHPELNTMSTALNMGNNDINNAKDIVVNGDESVGGGILVNGKSRHAGDATFGGNVGLDPNKYLYVDDVFLRDRNQWLSQITPKYVQQGASMISGSSYIGKPTCYGGGTPKLFVIPQSTIDQSYASLYYSGANSVYMVNHVFNWNYTAYDGGSYWGVALPSGPFSGGIQALVTTYCYYP